MIDEIAKHIGFDSEKVNAVLVDNDFCVPATWSDYVTLRKAGVTATRVQFSLFDQISSGNFPYHVIGLERAYDAFLEFAKSSHADGALIAKRKGTEVFIFSLPLTESNKAELTQIASSLQAFLLSLGFRGDLRFDSTQRFAKLTAFVEPSGRAPILERGGL